ncbi:hypothetical protein BGZ93_001741, partial [Podila epicladia]
TSNLSTSLKAHYQSKHHAEYTCIMQIAFPSTSVQTILDPVALPSRFHEHAIRASLHWFIRGLIPFSTLDFLAFRDFVQDLLPMASMPCSQTFRTRLPSHAQFMRGRVLRDWDMFDSVVGISTDAAPVIPKTVKLLTGTRPLIHVDPKMTQALHREQLEWAPTATPLAIKLDVKTRRNSTLYMVQCLNKLRPHIENVVLEPIHQAELRPLLLSFVEWSQMEALTKVLQPFDELTQLFSSSESLGVAALVDPRIIS